MQICLAFIYPSVSVCTTGTSIVPCVAIIACNLHRIRTGNSVPICNNAAKRLYPLRSYLTAEENYRFSWGVLNLQGVFLFLVFGEHYLLQMLLVYLPCLFYNPTPAAVFHEGWIFSWANLPYACVSFVTESMYQHSEVQPDWGGVELHKEYVCDWLSWHETCCECEQWKS